MSTPGLARPLHTRYSQERGGPPYVPCATHLAGGLVTSGEERTASSLPPTALATDGVVSPDEGEHHLSHQVWVGRAKAAGLVGAMALCILYMVKSYSYGLGSPASLGVGMMPLASGAIILVGLISLLVRTVLGPGRHHRPEDDDATVASILVGHAPGLELELPSLPADSVGPTPWKAGASTQTSEHRGRSWWFVVGKARVRLPTVGILDGPSIGGKLLRLLLVLAGALPLLFLSGSLGFVLASAILVIAAMFGMGERRAVVLVASAALVPIAEYLLFHVAFSLPLP